MATKPTVPEVLPLVAAYYSIRNNGAGGSLHTVLDDGNVHDHSVQFCIEYAGDSDFRGRALGHILLAMSKTQRLKLGARSRPDYQAASPAVEFDRLYGAFLKAHPDLAVPADQSECHQGHSE